MKNKNIHVLPTNKGHLYICDKGLKLSLTGTFTGYQKDVICQNIYITSEEEIKTGDWYKSGKFIWQMKYPQWGEEGQGDAKKIILTTDLDLIKDGVQPIPDEFLEWFVKNSSCEKVDIEEENYSQKCRECGETVKRGCNCKKGCFMRASNFIPTDENIKYKIMISKEDLIKHRGRVIPTEEVLANRCSDYEFIDFDKQETLEEAKKRFAYAHKKEGDMAYEFGRDMYSFEEGAKWQAEQLSKDDAIQTLEKGIALLLRKQEKMFTIKDLRKAIEFIPYHLEHGNLIARLSDKDIEKFIEQFKKK